MASVANFQARTPLARSRPIPPWLLAAAAASVLQLAIDWTGLGRHRTALNLLNFIVLDGLCLAVLWQFARARRRSDLPEDIRRAVGWIAAPMVVQALVGVQLIALVLVGTLFGRVQAWTSLLLVCADATGLLSVVLIPAALAKLPRAPTGRRGPARLVVNALTFIVGAGVPLWVFSLRRLLLTSADTDQFFAAIGPLFSFGGLLALSLALETRAALPDRDTFRHLLVGMCLLLLTDILFSVGKTSGLDYHLLVSCNDTLLFAGFWFWLVAAWRFATVPVDRGERRSLVAFSPLPPITIVVEVGFFVLLLFTGKASPENYPKVLAVVFLFLVILLLREMFVVGDSLRLVTAEAAQRFQARFEALVRGSSDVVMVVDRHRTVRFVSFAVQRVLNVAPESLVGRDLLGFIHPEDRPPVAAFLERTTRDSVPPDMIQWRFSGRDGEIRHLESTASNLLKDPAIEGIVLNSRDVSERRRIEDHLRQSQRLEAVGQLAGGVAHDFNNILTAIQVSVDLMVHDAKGTPTLQLALGELKECVRRGAALTRQLLLFSRRQAMQKQLVDLDALLANLVKMLRRLIGEQVRIEFRRGADAPRVIGDAGMLEQMVTNLVVNARDAMSGRGRVLIATDVTEFADADLGLHPEGRSGRFVHFSVNDTGCGMDAATLARIFEPFFTTKPAGRGTGLGLATVYGVVKEHTGWIEVESAVGSGSTFHVYLPAIADHSAPEPARSASWPALVGNETILLVEDDRTLRHVITLSLERLGYTVHETRDGDDALRVWAEHAGRVDLLLTDQVMPGTLRGSDLAERCRRDRPDLPVVTMSGYDPERSTPLENAPARTKHLRKPMEVEELVSAIRTLLDQKA